MKIFLLILIFFVSIALSIPNDNQHFNGILHFNRPVNSDVYLINSTQTVIFDISKYYYIANVNELKITFEVFSIAKQSIVDTIVEQENIWKIHQVEYLIDKVWANDGAKYFIIATIYNDKEYKYKIAVSNSGTFTTVNKYLIS